MKNLNTEKIIFAIIGTLTVVVLIFIVIFSVKENKQAQSQASIISYSKNDKDKPKLAISATFSDLGKMKVKDEKTAEFSLENSGNKPLQLFQISSSCDCTFGVVEIDGKTSPEFGMHARSSWVGTLDPGKKAILKVIYRPYIMPVSGEITRDVYVQTNDPDNPKLTFTVKADVE